jgi:predicted RNA-binding protein with PIN domain
MEESRETMSFKVSFQDETRRFTGSFSSYSELMTKATSLYKFDEQQLSSLRVQYMDDESELICMSSDEEFREMLRISRVPHIFLSLPAKRKREDESVADLGSDCCFQRGKTIRLLKKSGADPEKIRQEIALWKRQKQERKVLKLRAKLERKQKKIAEKESKKQARQSEKESRAQFRRDEKNLIPSIDSLSLASSPLPAISVPVPEPAPVPLPSSDVMEGGAGSTVQLNEARNAIVPANMEDASLKRRPKAKGRVHPLLIEDWNDGIRHLYLDGNNMLFVVPAIRSIVIRGGANRKTAETRLAAVAQHFTAATASKALEGTVLVFDNTHLEYSQEMLSVRSARPAFATSDDALVHWSAEHNNPKELLVVTSDRGLQDRLFEKGVPVMKPGRWFKMVESILGTELFQTLVASH